MPPITPYSQFTFLVEIDGIESAAFSEVSGLEVTLDVIEYRSGVDLSVRKIPGLPTYSNITLKRGFTENTEMWKWFQRSLFRAEHRPLNLAIVQLNSEREPAMRWEIYNAWPTRYKGPVFNALAAGVAIEELELVHEGLDVEWP